MTRLSDGLEAGHALAAAGRQDPVAVRVTERLGLLDLAGVGHALALGVHDRCQLLARGRLGEVSEIGDDLGTDEVEDFDGDERETSALVTKGEVNTFLSDRDAPYLGVDDHLQICGEVSGVECKSS